MSQEQEKIIEHPVKPYGQNGEPLFDNRVKIVNAKTGQVVGYQPYAWHVSGGDKAGLYERPIGSGNMFNGNGEPIGRYEFRKDGGGVWVKIAEEHIATRPQALNEKDALRDELSAAKAELEQMKKERDSKEVVTRKKA